MVITQKSQYGLRAVFELAKRFGQGPTRIATIADEQGIPQRFLEGILSQLRQAGIVDSHRGRSGGYMLAKRPQDLTVCEVIEQLQGPLTVVVCTEEASTTCPHGASDCVFLPMWREARDALRSVYLKTTFEDLVEHERTMGESYVPHYSI